MGAASATLIEGGAGEDWIWGGAGSDSLFGDDDVAYSVVPRTRAHANVI